MGTPPSMETNTLDYREFLKRELFRRCRNNTEYSLRAFARDLKMAPSQLSRVLKGQRNLSVEKASLIVEHMGTAPSEQAVFLSLVEMATAKNDESKERAKEKLMGALHQGEGFVLPLQEFGLISDWYHLAVFEMLGLDSSLTVAQLAKKLGLSSSQAGYSVELLLRLGLLKEEKGRYLPTHKKISIGADVSSRTIKKYHRQNIEKALTSIEEQSTEERHLSSKTFAVAKKNVPKLKIIIEEFKERVSTLLQEEKRKDSLYQLNIQLFQLDRKEK